MLSTGAGVLGCAGGKDPADGTTGAVGPDADPPPGSLLAEPLGELPGKLSEVGLYRDLSRLTVSRRAIAYEPGYPLWSDGGEKQRLLVLPDGESVDASDPEAYVFPVGTLIFKTFSFLTEQSPEQTVPVETRLLRLTDDGWKLDAYAWDEAGADAELLELKRTETRTILSDDGEAIEHAIPSRLECRQCHESSASMVLGTTELQLAKSGDLERLLPHLAPTPSEPYAALPEHGPLTSQVLGYLVGNCVTCHNGGNGASSSYDLRPEVALENLIDQPTMSSAAAPGVRVIPGNPEESQMFLAVSGSMDLEVKDMPPVGVALRDAHAIDLLREWITALGTEGAEP
ncbi:MAG TPA: hypothetical protein VJN18_04800 [Polyangiaceae bacterium]|nr:hypothetical protein [Polyangiaceae bacterium]